MKLKEIKLDDMHTLGKHLGKIGKRYHIPEKHVQKKLIYLHME